MSDGVNGPFGICAGATNAQPHTDRLVGRCLEVLAMEFTKNLLFKKIALWVALWVTLLS